ncbi:MAG: ATP synthase F1 subunit gamma [Polyangiaceae bacterium]|nr:ATP synthase F1 subunit gamma [Polyangiaceae bacterium]
MANQKVIRKRIASVKSTQKITRAMKMVAGARLNRAQQRITAMRPYAMKTTAVLAEVTAAARARSSQSQATEDEGNPLLAQREVNSRLLLVITADRGLCGAFNTNINRRSHSVWRDAVRNGQTIKLCIIGRKGRDYFRRRSAPIQEVFQGVWDQLGLEQARRIGRSILEPFIRGDVDSIDLIYNEFKSAMTQRVVVERLFPLPPMAPSDARDPETEPVDAPEFQFEPSQQLVLERLVPMYIEISILRALYESMASELGARMTAMDSATKNASDIIDKLTLQYNRARQAAITKELMEIIGGAEALKG